VAGLEAGTPLPTAAQEIPARVQIAAVAWLRWRIFINSTFRRRTISTRQAVGLAFAILVRIIVWPFLALMVIGPIGGSGFFAWSAIAGNHPQHLAPLLAAITLLWLFVSVNGQNVAAVVSNFDPSSLIRFPLRFGRYLVLRTFIGAADRRAPSSVASLCWPRRWELAWPKPALALPALVVLAVYALMNIFLMRMIGAWMERWLANRRFREIFSVLMALSVCWISVAELSAPTARANGGRSSWMLKLLHSSGSQVCAGCRRDSPRMRSCTCRIHLRRWRKLCGTAGERHAVRGGVCDPAAQAVSRRVPERGRKPR
jgi:hypothetical protein